MFWRKKKDGANTSQSVEQTAPLVKAQQDMGATLVQTTSEPKARFVVGGGSSQSTVREIDHFMDGLMRRNPHEPEFHQAVFEFVETVMPFYLDHRKYTDARILERMTEPDRIVSFRIVWEDDNGVPHANKGFRVQFNSSMGPYKGGLRFDPSVNVSILKFLGFEQTYKNALTRLPMGGGKGGSNFHPKGRSDGEIMRFCHAMMSELFRHIGESIDVPAGDIGVGAREIGYLFGKYKQLSNHYTGGVLTGKGLTFGGSEIRKEATGYGVVVFAEDMLQQHGKSMKGKTVAVSGSGNVAIYAVQRAIRMGAKVVTASDSRGFVHLPDGFNDESFAILQDVKENRRASLAVLASEAKGVSYHAGKSPWTVPCNIGLPCATQNEIDEHMAATLVKNGIECLAEGANMPLTAQAIHVLKDANVIFGPAKAANAGGVGCSGLEQAQNAQRLIWTRQQVEAELEKIMRSIHKQCVDYAPVRNGVVDYQAGANISSFARVADAMLSYGYL